jgi:predicted cupin superfamily sugar epimerase
MDDAQRWIEKLELEPHPEGGWFREFYRSEESIPHSGLPDRFPGTRNFSTAIYYLLGGSDFSALHRIRQDELLHYYDGASLTIHIIDPDRTYSKVVLGRRIEAGETLVAVVKAGCLFGAEVNNPSSFTLIGCTVAPGFDFADFEVPGRDELLAEYPDHRALIERLTR